MFARTKPLNTGAYLQLTEQIFKGNFVGNDGTFSTWVKWANQGEGQVQDVTVQQGLLFFV